jgi:outer membrane lipopolysaccharide assembly protein LptE/RlpB
MDTSTPNVSTMAIPRRRVPIRTAQRRVPIRILGALAAILVFTKLLHASLHLEASNLIDSPKYGSPPDLDINSKEYESHLASITTSVSKQVNAATLLQNETAAWEFSSNETALLSRSIPVFRSIWNDIQGQECQKIIVDRLSNLQQHLKKLDIFV